MMEVCSFLPYSMFCLFINLSGSPVSHSRPGGLLAERGKQLFQTPGIPVSPVVFLFPPKVQDSDCYKT